MFSTRPRGHQAHYYAFFVVIVLVSILGRGTFVVGRPQFPYTDTHNSQDEDSPRAEAAEGHHYRDSASPPSQPALRFAPEPLLLEPPSLGMTSSSSNSNNVGVGPIPPVLSPYRQPYVPSQPPASAYTNNNKPSSPHHDHQNKNPDHHHHDDNDDGEDFNNALPFSGDGSRAEFFGEDLDGPRETWEQDPDDMESQVPPPATLQQQQQQRKSWLPGWSGSRTTFTTTVNQKGEDSNKVAAAVVPVPSAEDNLSVDRFHGNLLGSVQEEEDSIEDLDVARLRLKTRDSEPASSAAAGSEGYVHAPRWSPFTGFGGRAVQGGIGVSSSSSLSRAELTARDAVEVDGPPMSNPHNAAIMPDDVPADPGKVVPWPDLLQRDVDVDRPIHYGAASSSSSSSLPERAEPPAPRPAVSDAELRQWKKFALGDLSSMDGNQRPAYAYNDDTVTDADANYENARNPFEDEGEEDEEDEVPEELVRQVIEAMKAPSTGRRLGSLEAETASLEGRQEISHEDDDDDEEGEGYWVTITGDDYDDEEAEEDYLDWTRRDESSSGSDLRSNSRLITLIFETIGAPDETLDEDEDEEGDEVMSSADAYEKELSIWQVLTNFPFPMLLQNSNQFRGSFPAMDYSYDDDDDDDDYDEEYYDDDYYDEEYDDEEEYEDYYDDEEEEEEELKEEEEEKDERNQMDGYLYDLMYSECEDCVEDDDVTATEQQQQMTVLSLPSMLTR